MYYKVGTASNDAVGRDRVKLIALIAVGTNSLAVFSDAAGNEIFSVSALAHTTTVIPFPGEYGSLALGLNATVTITGGSDTRLAIV